MKFWSMRREGTGSVDRMDGLVSPSSSSSSSYSSGDSGWPCTFSFSLSSSSSSSSTSSSLSRSFAVLQLLLLLLAFLVHPAQSSPPSTSSSSSSSSSFIARRLLRFNYMTNGLDWPEVCTGPGSTFQSPVNIPLDDVIPVPVLGDLKHRANYPLFTDNVSICHDNKTISVRFPGDHTMRMPKFRAQESFNASANVEWEADTYGPKQGFKDGGRKRRWRPVSKTYKLLECHFHSVSETEIDGTHADLEMHCVHTLEGYPALGVWGVFFNRTASENNTRCLPFIDKVVQTLEKLATCPPFELIPVDLGTFSLEQLFPYDGTYFHFYPGSLTTPPCTEGLLWYIFKNTLPVCDHQLQEIQKFVQLLSGLPALNFRDVQPLNDRRIYCWEDDLDKRRR